VAAGLHAVLRLPAGTAAPTCRAAREAGIALDELADYRHPQAPMPEQDGLVIGYGAPPEHTYAAALAALCEVLPPAG
jgi:GntR family transcriptional regulator/MocR family aminotransferase